MTQLIVYAPIHLACAFLHVGFMLGYSKGAYPMLWRRDRSTDAIIAILIGLLGGPIALIFGYFLFDQFEHGWTLK